MHAQKGSVLHLVIGIELTVTPTGFAGDTVAHRRVTFRRLPEEQLLTDRNPQAPLCAAKLHDTAFRSPSIVLALGRRIGNLPSCH